MLCQCGSSDINPARFITKRENKLVCEWCGASQEFVIHPDVIENRRISEANARIANNPPEYFNLILRNRLALGDCLVMSGAIETLCRRYPKFKVAVDTPANELYDHNPHIVKADTSFRTIDMHYPLINHSSERPVHFIQGYHEYLGGVLNIPLDPLVNRPYLYLSEEERRTNPLGFGPCILVCCSMKLDFTVKHWGITRYQRVVDLLNEILPEYAIVQVGSDKVYSPPLRNVTNMVGHANIRQLIQLAYHSVLGIGPESFLHHIFAALPSKREPDNPSKGGRPFCCISSGFMPKSWQAYNTETYITRQGQLDCCPGNKGCGANRTRPLYDDSKHDKKLCLYPVHEFPEPLPKCMDMIHPGEVIEAVLNYHKGGLLAN